MMGVHNSGHSKSNIRLLFTIMIFVFMAVILISVTGAAEDSDAGSTFTVDKINYEVTSGTEVKVISNSYTGVIVIPSSVTNGTTYSVTSIDNNAFQNCSSLTSVTIPGSVTSIDSPTFFGCSSLTSVTIGNGVKSICDFAFEMCTSLTTLTIPDSVTSIGNNAFNGCSSLSSIAVGAANNNYSSANGILFNKNKTEIICYPIGHSCTEYTIPDGVTSIGSNAFKKCSSLISVTIGNSVISIGNNAFNGCSSLSSVNIGNSVISIGEMVFLGCSSLSSLTVDAANNNYSSDDNVLFNKNKTELIQYPIGNTRTEYAIPDSVTSIGTNAFSGCTALSTIMFMGAVTSIGANAFNLSHTTDVSCTAIGCSDGQLDTYKGSHTTFTYKFWVTYGMNGGSGFIDPDAVKGSYTVKEYSGTKAGYSFIGWNDGANTYSPGTSVNIAANTAYTAVWEQLYLVTYDVDGGSGSVDSEYVKGTYVLKSYLGTKDGYTFKGWSDGTDTYGAGASVDITKDTAYKAVWEKNSSGGGSNTGLIIGIVVAVIAVIGIGAFFVIRKK